MADNLRTLTQQRMNMPSTEVVCVVLKHVRCNGPSCVGDPGLSGGVGPEGEPQDCTVQGFPGDPGQKGDPGEPGTDAVVTNGVRYIEIQSEIERLKTDFTCCNGLDPARRRRQAGVIGAGGSDTSLPDDLVCR